jgi:serine/threonine-protein kinase
VQRRTAQALSLDPASPEIRFWRAGAYLLPLGNIEEAIAEIQRALEIDPLSVFLRCWLALMFDLGRQYDQGLQEANLALELDPSSYIPHFVLGHLYRDKHMFAESITAHRVAVERSGGAPLMLGWLGLPVGLSGDTSEARSILKHLYGIATRAYVPPTSFAWVHFALGEVDDAFGWMDRAIDARDPMMTPIKTYAFMDPIRDDQRFHALLRKMNLES